MGSFHFTQGIYIIHWPPRIKIYKYQEQFKFVINQMGGLISNLYLYPQT